MATNIVWHEGNVSREERVELNGQKGVTLWLTGLSGSGKSTVASALEIALLNKGIISYRLDGDNVRFGLNKDLGFSPQDREENIRRIGEVSKLFNDSGVVAISSFISPYIADRELARQLHLKDGLDFIEVYVDVPLEVAEERDPKGLYKKAREGVIKEFTGISAPYEAPTNPEIHLDTSKLSIEDSVKTIIDYLKSQKLVSENL